MVDGGPPDKQAHALPPCSFRFRWLKSPPRGTRPVSTGVSSCRERPADPPDGCGSNFGDSESGHATRRRQNGPTHGPAVDCVCGDLSCACAGGRYHRARRTIRPHPTSARKRNQSEQTRGRAATMVGRGPARTHQPSSGPIDSKPLGVSHSCLPHTHTYAHDNNTGCSCGGSGRAGKPTTSSSTNERSRPAPWLPALNRSRFIDPAAASYCSC